MKYIKLLKKLQKKIKYFFNKKKLLLQALTHKSYGKINNEKLEFIGDSILNYIISIEIYYKFPLYNEGIMSKIRAKLVKSNSLIKIAKKIKLQKYIKAKIQKKNNKIYQKSILENTIEALIGSIFLDSNINTTKKIILYWYQKKINQINLKKIKDAKTKLQEYTQKKKIPLPVYYIKNIYTKKNTKKFYIVCKIQNIIKKITKKHLNKKKAEQKAAKSMLKFLKKKFYEKKK